MNRIPFTLPDVGLREIEGMVYVDETYLVLRVKNALLGVVDTEKDLVKIEPQALEALHIKPGIVKDRLVIKPKGAALLDLIPGKHRAALELRIWRTHRKDLQALVEAFQALR